MLFTDPGSVKERCRQCTQVPVLTKLSYPHNSNSPSLAQFERPTVQKS